MSPVVDFLLGHALFATIDHSAAIEEVINQPLRGRLPAMKLSHGLGVWLAPPLCRSRKPAIQGRGVSKVGPAIVECRQSSPVAPSRGAVSMLVVGRLLLSVL